MTYDDWRTWYPDPVEWDATDCTCGAETARDCQCQYDEPDPGYEWME